MIAPWSPLEEARARELQCEIVAAYTLDPIFGLHIARIMVGFETSTGKSLRILSGHRSAEEQEQLILQGTGAPQDLSNHRLCPAHAVDFWPIGIPTAQIQAELGRLAFLEGLRWGGCDHTTPGCVDPDTGMPQDWNHVDDGPVWEKRGR